VIDFLTRNPVFPPTLDGNIICLVWEELDMEINKILNPKGWLIGLGVFVLLFSVSGVMDPESVAEMSWGEDVEITDEMLAYESMWALHMIPFGILAITTALVVKGESLAKLAMTASASIVLIVGGGMMYFTNHYGYSNEGTLAIVMPLVVMAATIAMGVGGYLSYKDLTSGE
tara:strand:+ start:51 stop:566 length:516 start_codon:yes stop_codon:yes gene_type:complete